MANVDRGLPGLFDYDPAMTPETYYIRLRGLPFSAREEDVRNFLNGISTTTVTFTLTATGRASGECYVELSDTSAVKDALLLHKKELGGRYIEVFSVSEQERVQMVRNGVLRGPGESDIARPVKYVVRLRGLPFETNNDDIKDFFEGLDIEDIVIDLMAGGRPSGEAFVRFATKEHAEKALERNKSYMGSRYVEVFRSSWDEMENSYFESHGYPPARSGPIPLREAAAAFGMRDSYRPPPLFPADEFCEPRGMFPRRGPMGPGPMGRGRGSFRPSPYGDAPFPGRRGRFMPEEESFGPPGRAGPTAAGRRGEVKVFMRGMPYSVTATDIELFFDPLRCQEIKLGYGPDGRPSGDSVVTFGSAVDFNRSLSRSGRMMGSRYVEIFPASEMPASGKRIEFRSVTPSSPSMGRPSPSAKNSLAGYGREKNRGPPPPNRITPRPLSATNLMDKSPSAPMNKNIPIKKDTIPTPVPKPVPLAQLNSSIRQQNVGSYSEGTGVGNGYGYGSFSSAQQPQQQTSYTPQPSYTSQTPSAYTNPVSYNAQPSYNAPAAYSVPATYSTPAAYGTAASYTQPAAGYGTTPGYGAPQTTYTAPSTYSTQPYYSQSAVYGQTAAAYGQPAYGQATYGQAPYGTPADPSKPTW